MSPTRVRIALADDHAIVRMGFRRLLEMEPELSVVAEYADVPSASAGLLGPTALALDLLILDLSMPGPSGLELLRQLRLQRAELKVLVVTMHDSAAMQAQCQRAGASGFLPKSSEPQALVEAVWQVLRGQGTTLTRQARALRPVGPSWPHEQLTLREHEVLQHLLAGRGVDAIAPRLGVTEKTVFNVQTLIRQKLGVSSTVELLHYAQQHGLVPA